MASYLKIKQSVRQNLKLVMPQGLYLWSRRLYGKLVNRSSLKERENLIHVSAEKHERAVRAIRESKDPIKVVFLALMSSVWKYEELYRLMEKDDRFNPLILVCPVVNYGRENMIATMKECHEHFKNKGYNVEKAYDEEKDSYVDLKTEIVPDVIFYTSPYKGMIDDRYYITEFQDYLTCYVDYCYVEDNNFEIVFDSSFVNLLWRKYSENEYFARISRKYSQIKGENVVVTGYTGTDSLILNRPVEDPWKIHDSSIKRIIWAPHHTITNYAFVNYSTFLDYYELMLKFAEIYRNQIQIAFKPHPLLRNRLNILWGEKKTTDYYSKWEKMENGMICAGDYTDLFLTSDAIIHDCGSFIAEYMFTGKPGMHLKKGSYRSKYNKIAKKCLENYYTGDKAEDIEKFIKNVVIEGNDIKKEKREKFIKECLLPPHNRLASENILEDLVKSLRP